MSRMFEAVKFLDGMGLRRPIAVGLSLLMAGRRFSVDRQGYWINRQNEATIVSPTLHVTPYAKVHDWVVENWCWDYRPGPGDVVIDVGAGIGEETVAFSKMVGSSGRVISIEAHPGTYAALAATVEASGLDNVTLLHCAVTDADGTIRIGTAAHHVASSIFDKAGIAVPAKTLDTIARDLGLDDIAFIKMNIEGAEKLAVHGMGATFPRLKAACISCHDFVADLQDDEQYRSRAEVLASLSCHGFLVRTRDDHQDVWVRDYLYASRRDAPNPH